MFYVYLLKSKVDPSRIYVGFTNNFERCLNEHNNLDEPSWTKRYMPWELKTYLSFENEKLARQFEIYLKSHSGKAFLKKHFI